MKDHVVLTMALLRQHRIGSTRANRILRGLREQDIQASDVLQDPVRFETQLQGIDGEKLRDEVETSRAVIAGQTEAGATLLSASEDAYPVLLRERLGDGAPALLSILGPVSLLSAPGVAVAGSRRASVVAGQRARACGLVASEREVVLISGGAKGVDTEAHLGAIRGGGRTVVVLAEGLDKATLSPELFDAVDAGRAAIVSEFLPGERWTAGRAMQRNRTIVCMAGALVVVAAGETGGSLAAGRLALKRGVPLFVGVEPGDAGAGTQILVNEGATPLATGIGARASLEPVWLHARTQGGGRRDDSVAKSGTQLGLVWES